MSLEDILQNAANAKMSVEIKMDDFMAIVDKVAESKLIQREQGSQSKQSDELLTPAETCKILKISRSSLTRWSKSEYLIPTRIGGQIRYKKQDIDRILKSNINK